MAQKIEKVVLPDTVYQALLEALERYLAIPEYKRPLLVNFRAVRAISRAHVLAPVTRGYLTQESKYFYGARTPDDPRHPEPEWFYLTGISAPIVQWWIDLGFDKAALEAGERPPREWESTYEEEDYIPHYKKYRVKSVERAFEEPDKTTPGEVEVTAKKVPNPTYS